jgi:UPF0755 protein
MTKTKPASVSFRTVIILAVAFVVFALGKGFYQQYLAGPPDYAGPGHGSTSVTVTTGESLAQIANSLKTAGAVKSVDAFIAATTHNPKSGSIQPGHYKLKLEMASRDALAVLIQGATRTSTAIVIPEGLRTATILKLIASQSSISLASLKAEIAHPASLGLPRSASGNVEGYLFPSSYEIDGHSNAHSVLSRMVALAKTTHRKLGLTPGVVRHGHSEQELLTVASILEAEAHPRDFAKVARVIYNRIQTPMRLQMDSTVAYGLGIKRVMLTQNQLDASTPYNTYLNDGLPPGPIDNPGEAAIHAALHPATGDWLYFLTVNLDTQETKFTNSYNAFLTYKSQFLNYCRSHRGKC